MEKVQIKPLTEEDKSWVSRFTAEQWGASRVVMRGQVYDVAQLLGVKAVQKGKNILPQTIISMLYDSIKRRICVGGAAP